VFCENSSRLQTLDINHNSKVLARFDRQGATVNDFVLPTTESQVVFSSGGSLSNNASGSITITIENGSGAWFVVDSSQPLSFNLVTPSGQVIDPMFADATLGIGYLSQKDTFANPNGYTHQYFITSPQAGYWRINLSDSNALTPTLFSTYALISSTVRLDFSLDKQQYYSGEPAVLTAMLNDMNSVVISPATQMTASILNLGNNATQTLTLHDDGINGDVTANDGVYTTLFNAPTISSYYPAASIPHFLVGVFAQNGTIRRFVEDRITITPNIAHITGIASSGTTDKNNNTLFDTLDFSVTVQVTNSAQLRLFGSLLDASNNFIATTSVSQVVSAGNTTMVLAFSGKEIRRKGLNGPYRLQYLTLSDESSFEVDVDQSALAFTTTVPYSATQFEIAPLNILSTTEQLIDADSNDKAEALRLIVQPENLTPGDYLWSGELAAADGSTIAFTYDSGTLTANQPITFKFLASDIIHAYRNGPYKLTTLSIARVNYGGDPAANKIPVGFFFNVRDTAPYTLTQFEGVNTAPSGAVCTPLNRTGWATSASVNAANSGLVKDGITTTLWSTSASQQPTHTFSLDMGSPQALDGVQLDATGDVYSYLRSYDVQVSNDGVSYTSVASGTAEGANEVIRFAPQTARYVRVLPLAANPAAWSLGELNVCAQSAPLPISINGPTITVSGTAPVRLEYLSFNGSANQVLHLHSSSTPTNVTRLIRIYRPNGVLLGEREMSNSFPAFNDYSGDWFMDPLPESGTYLIRVEYYDSANMYSFSLTSDQGGTATPTPTATATSTSTSTPTSTPIHTPTPTASGTETIIYGDALASGWLNWSGSGTFNLSNTSPVQSGDASAAVSFTGAWAGSLTFKTFSNPVTNYDSLRFWVHGGASGASFTFYAQNSSGTNSPFIDLSAPANTWTEFVITKAQLNNLSNLARLDWSANGSSTSATFFVDHVRTQ
jgi:hypothetical protein